MDAKFLLDLLKNKNETDWLEFKQKFEIYDSEGKVVLQQRDELIKDILGLANGNSHIIRKTKYLIVGVDNGKFDDVGIRILHDINYDIPTRSEIIKWLNGACSPSVDGIECEFYPLDGKTLFIITIPPTFDIHETTRELNASGHFNKHTVFMRQDEHTVPASVRDGVIIQQRKQLHRREIENPAAGWPGAIGGALAAAVLTGVQASSRNANVDFSNPIIRILLILFSAFMGAMIGDFTKFVRSTWYDWHFMTFREKAIYVVYFSIAIPAMYFLFIWLSKVTK